MIPVPDPLKLLERMSRRSGVLLTMSPTWGCEIRWMGLNWRGKTLAVAARAMTAELTPRTSRKKRSTNEPAA